jgi:hypothetical protein
MRWFEQRLKHACYVMTVSDEGGHDRNYRPAVHRVSPETDNVTSNTNIAKSA